MLNNLGPGEREGGGALPQFSYQQYCVHIGAPQVLNHRYVIYLGTSMYIWRVASGFGLYSLEHAELAPSHVAGDGTYVPRYLRVGTQVVQVLSSRGRLG